jgi:hypothetical protein
MSRYHGRIDDGTRLYCFSASQTAAWYGMKGNVCESYRWSNELDPSNGFHAVDGLGASVLDVVSSEAAEPILGTG